MMISLIARFHLELHFLADKLEGLAFGTDNEERAFLGVGQRIIGTALYYQ
jgi:hypothetical protein